jgi:asparagine synthase (glutamine-hydrolysing)
MTMAHGLEARVPFLDHRLVEFAARVPPAYKMRYFYQKKYLLKRSLEGRLPAKIIHRRKSGFNMPNARWIKHEMRPFVLEVLSPDSLKRMGLFDLVCVERLLEGHFSGQSDNSHQIWCLLSLSLWWRQFQEKAGVI